MNKILVIDDDKNIRSIYRRLLYLEHYEVLEAKDWQVAALLIAGQKDIDLILLDINMPMVDGVALYDVIRRYDPHIKIIVSSVCSLEDQKRLITTANDYYDKSCATEILVEKIKNALCEPLSRSRKGLKGETHE